jgi:hypothetical protein
VHVRVASEVVARALTAAALALVLGCRGDARDDVRVQWAIEPARPVTRGETVARITLQDARQQPVRGARLRLEAHMSHPGMTPVIAAVTERGEGLYEARLQFSMAGDWILVIAGELPDGSRITRSLEIAGVRSGG